MEKILKKLEQLKRKHNILYWILLVKTIKLFSSKLKEKIENTLIELKDNIKVIRKKIDREKEKIKCININEKVTKKELDNNSKIKPIKNK